MEAIVASKYALFSLMPISKPEKKVHSITLIYTFFNKDQ
jgi:hypothetical protein